MSLCRRRLIAGRVDLHLVLHAIVDRGEFDVLAQGLVALQQQPELHILDRVLSIATPSARRFEDLASAYAQLALVMLTRAVEGRERLLEEITAHGAGEGLAKVRKQAIHIGSVVLEDQPQDSHVQAAGVHRNRSVGDALCNWHHRHK